MGGVSLNTFDFGNQVWQWLVVRRHNLQSTQIPSGPYWGQRRISVGCVMAVLWRGNRVSQVQGIANCLVVETQKPLFGLLSLSRICKHCCRGLVTDKMSLESNPADLLVYRQGSRIRRSTGSEGLRGWEFASNAHSLPCPNPVKSR